jgi:hypothetical protein
MINLVQLRSVSDRAIALVDGASLRTLATFETIYALVQSAISRAMPIKALIGENLSDDSLDYDAIHAGKSEWKLMLPFHHPVDPARVLVSGTGLTHRGSAMDRQAMHGGDETELSESMKMYKWGVERGKPATGQIGVSPEWFYKGNGTILRAHGEPLEVPSYALDGGEEAEIAGIYLIGPDGRPYRVGMCIGNEFSDHKFEKLNYLNLAGSKVRNCSIGPELVIDAAFASVAGKATISRGGKSVWSKTIRTGENEMCHSLANIEHHHFKFEAHRRPGDVHVHFFGAHSLSFGDGIELQDGDEMSIAWEGFGRPLRNSLRHSKGSDSVVSVTALQ